MNILELSTLRSLVVRASASVTAQRLITEASLAEALKVMREIAGGNGHV